MEAGSKFVKRVSSEETNRRIVDIISDVNMAYSEHARRYLADCGLPKERTYVTGSPMAESFFMGIAAAISKLRCSPTSWTRESGVHPAFCSS